MQPFGGVCAHKSFPPGNREGWNRQMTIERCDALCSNSGVWRGELMVFIIMSPFPFHFLYKLAQVPCCVPERAHQRQPAEMHLQTHCSGVLLSLLTQVSPSFAFLQPTYSSSPFCLLHLHFTVLLAFSLFSFLHYFIFVSCPSFPVSSFFPHFPLYCLLLGFPHQTLSYYYFEDLIIIL